MKKLLLVIWCIRLADEKPLHPEFTAQYIFTSSKQIKTPTTKFPQSIKQIGKNKITEPEFGIPSFSAQEPFDASNHESGYSILSKTFTNSITSKHQTPKYISDKRIIYDSITNPLYESKSLKLNDENDHPKVIGDIHKFSSPFESKWILSPRLTKLFDDTAFDEFQSIFNALKFEDHHQSAIQPTPDSVFPAPSNLDLERYNKVDNSVNSLDNLGKDQFDEIVKDNTDILSEINDNTVFESFKEKSNFNHAIPNNGTFVGYNLQEVKTPQGEVQGVMQIFDKNGVAQKIHYNEKGVLNKTINNATTNGKSDLNSSKGNDLHRILKTAVNQFKQNNISKPITSKSKTSTVQVTTKKPLVPEVKKISVKIEGHNYSNTSSPQHKNSIDDLKSPENILSDFLKQINIAPTVPDNANVRTDIHNSFHETVSENSYSYT